MICSLNIWSDNRCDSNHATNVEGVHTVNLGRHIIPSKTGTECSHVSLIEPAKFILKVG